MYADSRDRCMRENDVAELLENLVTIESHESVDAIRDYLVETIENATVHQASGCVVASKGERSGEPHVFLNSHMDVVPPHAPFQREGDIIKGRGACDAKGSLSSLIAAFSEVDPDSGRVTLVISPDEETYSEGLFDFLQQEGDTGDMAIVGEPTNLDVCNAGRGSFKYRIDFEGERAHVGTAESGTSALACVATAVQRLEGLSSISDDRLGQANTTVTWATAGRVGEDAGQVPKNASCFVSRWSVPPETPSAFKHQIEKELEALPCKTAVRYPYQPNRFLEAYHVDSTQPVIEGLCSTVEEITGNQPAVVPFAAAAESSFFSRYMPVAVFGPGQNTDEQGAVVHSDREYIDISEVRTAADVLMQFLEETV